MANAKAYFKAMSFVDDNLSFGANISAAPTNAEDNDTFVITSDGTPTGDVLEVYKFDAESGLWINLTVPDTFRVVQALVAGNNVITHNLGGSDVEVEVRNDATGAIISARVIAETPTTTTLFVPVAVAAARITVDF